MAASPFFHSSPWCARLIKRWWVLRDVDVACLVGAMPRKPGMERKDLLLANANIFENQVRYSRYCFGAPLILPFSTRSHLALPPFFSFFFFFILEKKI
jgi:hypothetical protein